jgi:hypothetical protein
VEPDAQEAGDGASTAGEGALFGSGSSLENKASAPNKPNKIKNTAVTTHWWIIGSSVRIISDIGANGYPFFKLLEIVDDTNCTAVQKTCPHLLTATVESRLTLDAENGINISETEYNGLYVP